VVRSRRSGDNPQKLAFEPSRCWWDMFWLAIFMLHLVVVGFSLVVLGLNWFEQTKRLNIDRFTNGFMFWDVLTWLLFLGSQANQMMKVLVDGND